MYSLSKNNSPVETRLRGSGMVRFFLRLETALLPAPDALQYKKTASQNETPLYR